ncbi:hypothetical protein Bbelb_331270 [Branchiostoma belcheri]|nr:hypothetical protein Bbelb_331270 [Branchiostoma belcheri]
MGLLVDDLGTAAELPDQTDFRESWDHLALLEIRGPCAWGRLALGLSGLLVKGGPWDQLAVLGKRGPCAWGRLALGLTGLLVLLVKRGPWDQLALLEKREPCAWGRLALGLSGLLVLLVKRGPWDQLALLEKRENGPIGPVADLNECTRNPCLHGRCANKNGGYKCTCNPGWTGQNCQQDLNECTRNPWLHGRCVNKDGGYKCTCNPGWTGQNCQQDLNECTRKPCLHHGRCVNKDGGYKCICNPGWTGQNCQQDLNECTRNPCLHHGRCVNKDGGHKCTCNPGWTGQNFQQDLNECTRNPCQHGRCANKNGGYKCTCNFGFTGQNCQQVKPCPTGWSGNTNYCYKLMKKGAEWEKAKLQCEQLGANLASITSRGENNFINGIITDAPVGQWGIHLVWFGLHRNDGFRKFTDGSQVSYTNWEPGQPNNNNRHFLSRIQATTGLRRHVFKAAVTENAAIADYCACPVMSHCTACQSVCQTFYGVKRHETSDRVTAARRDWNGGEGVCRGRANQGPRRLLTLPDDQRGWLPGYSTKNPLIYTRNDQSLKQLDKC